MDSARAASRWDDEYRRGRYTGEPPLPFVSRILAGLDARDPGREGHGLYVGCGNGRNYLPLVDAGLDLIGLDLSAEALRSLTAGRPEVASRLVCADFLDYSSASRFRYLIAIQVFQHGRDADAARYFARTAELLEPGGLFFLRVNSASTEVYHRHRVVERNPLGGFTVEYQDGPKQGLAVHFYTRPELEVRGRQHFRPVQEPREEIRPRVAPQTGAWAQWEAIWERR